MLRVFVRGGAGRIELAANPRAALTGPFVWADLYTAGNESELRDDERAIEAAVAMEILTPSERTALEESARFYEDNDAVVFTATIPGQRADGLFVAGAVTFMLSESRLVTVRGIRPKAFELGSKRPAARVETAGSAAQIMMALLEGVVERVADLLQESSSEVNALSGAIFGRRPPTPTTLSNAVAVLGKCGGLAALCHESLASLRRVASYAAQVCERFAIEPGRVASFATDVEELERAAEGLQQHAGFVLNAALGLVSTSQNSALKALAVVTAVFMPPTLVASFFGMNFDAMTWFATPWGPWVAGSLMVATAAGLVIVGTWRRWF